jgi:uncharacterized membrane protein
VADLLVIEYGAEAQAEEARRRLLAMQKEYLVLLGDAVVAVKQDSGAIKLNQLVQPVRSGALSGALWGSLIGLLFAMPLAGAAFGAAGGALGGRLSGFGIDDDFMREAAQTLQSGNAALFLLVRKMTADKVMAELKDTGGKMMRSSLDETREREIREALAEVQAEIEEVLPEADAAKATR